MHTDRRAGRQRGREMKKGVCTEREKIERHTCIQTDRQVDRETER